MDNSITEKSPAKINLFLKILNRREDNYHNIRTGITSINLCDEIEVKPSNQFNVEYRGAFAPENNIFDDCIIKKIFSFLNISPPNISFSITKNFPYQAGLGSASSNAATAIKILENLEIINKKNIFDYTDLGSDIPFFLNQHDSLVRGRGDLISNIIFPKYFFLIIKPNFNCSTEKMYNTFIPSDFDYNIEEDIEEINDNDNGNDFEKVVKKLEPDFNSIYNKMDNFEDSIFTRLTGSGSCIFSVFENKLLAENAKTSFLETYPNLWAAVAENNNIKL